MYGVVAQQGSSLDEGGDDVLASIDFINEVYSVNGSTVVLSAIVDKPERLTVDGLEITDEVADGPVEIIGDLFTALAGYEWTILIEYEETEAADDTTIMAFRNDDFDQTLKISRESPSFRIQADETSNIVRDPRVTGPFGTGIHRVALTRTNDHIAISVDGSAVEFVDATPSPALVADRIALGGWAEDFSENACLIRGLDVYTVLSDAELPSLSSLS